MCRSIDFVFVFCDFSIRFCNWNCSEGVMFLILYLIVKQNWFYFEVKQMFHQS